MPQPVFNFQGMPAVLSMMALLSTILLLGAAGTGLLVLLLRGRMYASKRVALAGGGIAAAYLVALAGFSAAAPARTVEPGREKYFCEIDCHLAYSVAGAARAPLLDGARAAGVWQVVELRIRFDPSTTSARRGDAPLHPNPRAVYLVDGDGNRYAPSRRAGFPVDTATGATRSLDAPLRPGESHSLALAFDVPASAGGLRLAVEESSPETRLLIGHERSLFHRPTLFELPASVSFISEPLRENRG